MRTNARKLVDDPLAPKPLHDPATMTPGQLFRHLHRERTHAGVAIKRKVSIIISSSLKSQPALEFKVKPAQKAKPAACLSRFSSPSPKGRIERRRTTVVSNSSPDGDEDANSLALSANISKFSYLQSPTFKDQCVCYGTVRAKSNLQAS